MIVDWNLTPVFSACLYEHPMNRDEFILSGYRPSQFDAYDWFMNAILKLGAKPTPGAIWQGMHIPFPMICPKGHECCPQPASVQQGQGICRTCADRDSVQAENNFRIRLAELGAIPLYESWHGTRTKHHVRCVNGHDCYPRPDGVQRGEGICLVCASHDSVQAENNFRIRLAELGATALYKSWQGVKTKHHVRCVNGHDCYPRPDGVQQGQGICQQCFVNHDILYVMTGQDTVKFGITSGDPKHRLHDHKTEGFTEILRLYTSLPEGVARTAEQQAIAACHDAGIIPVRGREYYHIAALPVILDVIDGHAEAAGAVNRVICWDDVIANGEWSAALW